ncbi:MAG: nucleotide exchange factor GrpE, partial [Chromatiaceae bacterium]
MEEVVKEALTARFRAYLDDIESAGETEEADAATPVPDLFTLLAEVSALRTEVKLESRQFKTALDEFRALFDAMREANARLGDEQERRLEQERTASRETQKDHLLELL